MTKIKRCILCAEPIETIYATVGYWHDTEMRHGLVCSGYCGHKMFFLNRDELECAYFILHQEGLDNKNNFFMEAASDDGRTH